MSIGVIPVQSAIEVGRYVENIVVRWYIGIGIGTLDIGFSIYQYRISDK